LDFGDRVIMLVFVIAGKGDGNLGARIEYVPFRRELDGSASQSGPPLVATLTANPIPLEDPSGGAAVRVLWEAAMDFGGESSDAMDRMLGRG